MKLSYIEMDIFGTKRSMGGIATRSPLVKKDIPRESRQPENRCKCSNQAKFHFLITFERRPLSITTERIYLTKMPWSPSLLETESVRGEPSFLGTYTRKMDVIRIRQLVGALRSLESLEVSF